MDLVDAYLRIPTVYFHDLGGLHWSGDGEAVEFLSGGGTFAFGGEIVSFLEGFSLQRTFLPFGQILHLLCLLRHQHSRPGGKLNRLQRAFQEAGQVHRNAGAFCAVLCGDLPSAPEPPSSWQVWRRVILRSFSTDPEYLLRRECGEEPPLSPAEFEDHIHQALSGYDDADLVHWFKHARGPVKEPARKIAEALDADRPRSMQGVLGQLVQRERLSGAIPFVAQLVSALALPPRRMGPPELPLGGYSDVTNRGQPEHILPSQFALDDLEFVRRHAERELLYYRREEPHARTREELVILLDQGVRTWGTVRLVLTAALLAFGQLADRRRMPFWVATTSGGGIPRDPLQLSDEDLGEWVQGSDLTAHPGLALERTLQDESSLLRDVVLLTHPFSLAEADLAAAARRLRPGHRLFALAVDGHGQVQLSELRQGVPLRVSQFHVDLESRPLATPRASAEQSHSSWRGNVEPVGFPFRFGVESDPTPTLLFTFDHAGDWLLTASSHGMLHATRTDGSASEVLPRGMLGGKVLRDIDAVLGVAGGFVVAGELANNRVAFHYDWDQRVCTAHPLGPDEDSELTLTLDDDPKRWYYDRPLHSVVLDFAGEFYAIDLGRGTVTRRPEGMSRAGRALQKIREVCPQVMPPQLVVGATHPAAPEYGWVDVDDRAGEVLLYLPGQGIRRFTPLVDGQPTLRGHQLLMAQCCQTTLALALTTAGDRDDPVRLCLYRIPEGVALGEYKQKGNQWAHVLSSDGRLLARQVSPLQVEIRPRGDSTWGRVTTARGGFHSGATLELGDRWLVLQVTPQVTHFVRWWHGELVCHVQKGARIVAEGGLAGMRRLPPWLVYDAHRFQRVAWSNLIAVLDRFGQVFLFDHAGELLCSLFAFQEALAIRMPDGTCWGSETLLGRRATPDALKRIGTRLLDAWLAGKGKLS